MIKVNNLSVLFNKGGVNEKLAVQDVSFEIRKGEMLALVGESGSGKTVTALSIMQLLPGTATHPSGSILLENADGMRGVPEDDKEVEIIGANDLVLRSMRGNRVAIIFQEPMTSLNPLHTIEKQIGETLFIHKGLRREEARKRIVELLELVGMKDACGRLDSYPHEFSGGQRQRIMIAMALACEPELLIADEPTTALDVTVQAQILKLLGDLQKRLGMAILLITHDLAIVRKVAQRVCVMTGGRIVETGETERIFMAPQHEYTRHLIASRPQPKTDFSPADTPEIISADKLCVHFPIKGGLLWRVKRYVKAVDGVTFGLCEGRTLGIVGESGSGKTTLGLALLRLAKSAGTIVYNRKNIQGWKFKQMRSLRQEIQIVFQDPFGSLNPRMSIGQIIGEGLEVHGKGITPEKKSAMIREVLSEVGIDFEAEHRYPHEFSGGQRQRIAIARAIILKPKLIILDEPTSSLDMTIQAQIIDLLRNLQEKYGLTYVFISHDLQVIRAICDEILVMKDGCIVEHGSAREVINSPKENYTRALFRAAFDLEAVEDGTVGM